VGTVAFNHWSWWEHIQREEFMKKYPALCADLGDAAVGIRVLYLE
jgi:hypothetical protein